MIQKLFILTIIYIIMITQAYHHIRHHILISKNSKSLVWLRNIYRAYSVINDHSSKSEVDSKTKIHRLVFLGTPQISANTLQLLYNASKESLSTEVPYEISAVVSQPPALTGRNKKLTSSPVHELAEKLQIPYYVPETAKDTQFLEVLEQLSIDLCITAAYGNFLPKRFLSIPTYGTVNIHPSLLPLYRGAAPVQRCLENGDSQTGVSVVFTVSKMDAGPVINQIIYPLNGNEKATEVLANCFEIGTKSLISLLPSILTKQIYFNINTNTSSNNILYQKDEHATPANKLNASDALIDFNNMTATIIHNKCRGYSEWPGIYSNFLVGTNAVESIKIKLITTHVLQCNSENLLYKDIDSSTMNNQEVKFIKHNKIDMLVIKCADNSLLGITEVQPASKKIIYVKDFMNGLRGDLFLKWI